MDELKIPLTKNEGIDFYKLILGQLLQEVKTLQKVIIISIGYLIIFALISLFLIKYSNFIILYLLGWLFYLLAVWDLIFLFKKAYEYYKLKKMIRYCYKSLDEQNVPH